MQYDTHGGLCCGYGHIHGFDNAGIEDFDAAIEEHMATARGNNRILEAILTDRQLSPTADDRRVTREVRAAGGWPVLLASRGFRLAAQWVNSNTNRRCYQFLKIENLLTDDPDYRPAFNWEGAVAAAAQAHPVAPRPPAAPQELPVRVREGTVIDRPFLARLDPALPIQVRDGRTGQVYNGITVRHDDGNGVYIEVRNETAPESIREVWRYSLMSGDWVGDASRARAFNVREAAAPAPAPVPAPRRVEVVTTEFYAHLADRGRRGPFESVDAVREAYPRVRRIDYRNIMSDGSSIWLTVRD